MSSKFKNPDPFRLALLEEAIKLGIKACKTDSPDDVIAFLKYVLAIPAIADRLAFLSAAVKVSGHDSSLEMKAGVALSRLHREHREVIVHDPLIYEAFRVAIKSAGAEKDLATNEKAQEASRYLLQLRETGPLATVTKADFAFHLALKASQTDKFQDVNEYMKTVEKVVNPLERHALLVSAWSLASSESFFGVEINKALSATHQHPEVVKRSRMFKSPALTAS